MEWEDLLREYGSINNTVSIGGGVRLRVEAFLSHVGLNVGMSIRILPQRVPMPGEVGVPAQLQALLRGRPGIVIFSGPSGSGKSTTIASLCEYLNSEVPMHIQTIEDPVEYVFEDKKSFLHKEKLVSTAVLWRWHQGVDATAAGCDRDW